MNTDKMINVLLIKLSNQHDIFYMERRTYKKDKIHKTFIIKIDGTTEEFKSKRNLLLYLKEEI